MIIALQTLIFFRESLFAAIDRLLRPYYKHFSLTFTRHGNVSDDEESEDHVFAEFDDEKGVVFFPPMYAQRYAAVSDCLMDERWCGKLEKVVDFGYHDMSFIKYLKEVPGIKRILGVDIESIPLRCSSDLLGCDEYVGKRENPLQVTLYQGNAADPDYRLIGCDAVIAIEMIEHMLPQDLERIVHTIFGFIKPWVAVITTPNGDFNPLFISMERNGFRRLDHFFEWSREQFHDWCSNIVARYPQYTVSCRGVGPGPPGTIHYGCCSQLALFVSKDYHKQQDLNLNSLALVAKVPNPTDVCDTIGCLDTPVRSLTESNMLCAPNKLNCTTLQVKRFSKTTQKMLVRNKMDSIVHTREVVDDIKHLTRMLNFNNETKSKVEGDHLWYNINWGDNAPYWNQYYKTVREYSYPFEVKSEESRILDLISEEINRLIDMQLEDDFSIDVNKVEIPLERLMRVVQHITDNVERVKDLLEWNGYELVDDVLIYSRLVVDNASVGSHDDEWREDTFSDWDTDVHSTSYSDGSTIMPDYHGRCLYRALDHKIRKLRSMLLSDEDISAELDRVVCRLMKLALKTTRTRQKPLPMKWTQGKMLDLLNLTEKAIEKKKNFIGSYPLKAICYEGTYPKREEITLTKIKEDTTANEIVHKYRHLVRASDNNTEDVQYPYHYDNLDDSLSHKSSKEFLKQTISSELILDFDEIIRSPSLVDIEPTPKHPINTRKGLYSKNETTLSRTQAWLEEDVNVVRYPELSNHGISSGDTDHSINNITRFKNKKYQTKHKSYDIKETDQEMRRRKKSSSKASIVKNKAKNVEKFKNNDKTSKTRLLKKVVKKKSSYNILIKTCSKKLSSASLVNGALRSKRNFIPNISPEPVSKPIPESFMDLCRQRLSIDKNVRDVNVYKEDKGQDVDSIGEVQLKTTIATTEESLLIDIVMEDREETIALRRTIGTDADDEPALFEQEIVHGSLMNVMNADDSFYNKHETENVHSQTIFIYDINEPSTSKGVRHVSMDVQCGTDATNTYDMLSATTSFTRMPKIFNTGIKIGDSSPDMQTEKTIADFGTSTYECTNNYKTTSPRTKSFGIKIKDSDIHIKERVESSTMTQENFRQRENYTAHGILSIPNSFDSATDTQLLKLVSSRLKLEDSGSEFCESVASSRKSPFHFADLSKKSSDFQIKLSVSKDVGVGRKFSSKYVRPKLCCGGVHVHSYKDRQTSEDVVYQGEWQRYRPKSASRRKGLNSVVQKLNEIANKKSKTSCKEKITANKDAKLPLKRLTSRSVNFKKSKDEEYELSQVKNIDANKPIYKCNRSALKVANKLASTPVNPKTKQNKVSFVTKKPSKTSCYKEAEKPLRSGKKSYLPLYLKRKLALKSNNEAIIRQTNSTKTIIDAKERPIGLLSEITESNVEAKDNLLETLKIHFKPRQNVNLLVFRNESDPTTDSDNHPFTKELTKRDSNGRSPSPQSQNSSAYSSPNSIATVRARPTVKMTSDRRFSTSSNKSNLSNSRSENVPVKNKKFTKRAKSSKKPQEKDFDKENIPESSKRSKESEKSSKSAFMRNKNIFRAHVTSECSPQSALNSVSRHRPHTATKSNVRIPTIPCSSEKQSSATSSRPSVSKNSSPKSHSSLQSEHKSNRSLNKSEITSSDCKDDSKNLDQETNEGVIINIVDNSLLAEWMNTTCKNVIDSHTSNILAAMRQLVEERLDFIERMSDNLEVDSKTVILSIDKLESVQVSASASFHDSSSLNNSFGTVIEMEYVTPDVDKIPDVMHHTDIRDIPDVMHLADIGDIPDVKHRADIGDIPNVMQYADINDIQNIVNNTLDSILSNESYDSVTEPRQIGTDTDLLSFKSLTSASKLSEYFLAESSLNNATASRHSGPSGVPFSGSVKDIFERKNHLSMQNLSGVPGALAVQAFSGFSMNAEPIAGDQPDRINIADSETGSLALEYRQITSEEVFISGRSSSSYESCLIDEDAVVPNWLFQIISQQHSLDEEEEEEPLLPNPVPMAEPMFDVNGNAMEPGMGAGAGAGDGRGIHSDHSQDSSGHGTSFSSSDTSSGAQSEAILIDPIALTGQYDLMREPISSSALLPAPLLESPDTSYMTAEGLNSSHNNDILNSSGERCERTAPNLMVTAASDVDADVSSIDTDVLDSSDN